MTSCATFTLEHHNILRFLFVVGLATNLPVGGLGVEGKQNVLCMIDVEHKRSLPIRTENI